MQGIFGCAGMIAAVAFVIGLVASLFATSVSIGENLAAVAMTAAIAFVAATLLMYRDYFRHSAARRAVRRMLLARQDVVEREFSTNSPDSATALIAHTREAVAAFFDVPVAKVSVNDDLRKDLNFEKMEPGFHMFVICHVLKARQNSVPPLFTFNGNRLVDARDLASEIGRIIEDSNCCKDREGTSP